MSRPKLLDLGGCEGIGARGYYDAGWEPFGVDIDKNRLKYYPFEKWVGDALDMLTYSTHLDQFDAIHASPPCQYYSRGNAVAIKKAREANGGEPPAEVNGWPRLIPVFRELLDATGKPYVIENVLDAGWDMRDPVLLCGCMFDLSVRDYTCTAVEHEDRIAHLTSGACHKRDGVTVHLERGRLFETNWGLTAPRRCEGEGQPRNNHPSHEWVAGAYGGARRDKYEAKYVRHGGYVPPDMDVVKALIGVDHKVTWQGLKECIPPAYTEHIGDQLLAHIEQEMAA